MLDAVKGWIGEFVGQPLTVDWMDAATPGTGLYPKGLQPIRRSMDILGNESVRYRCRFTLRHVAADVRDKTRAAAWLLDFQNWVCDHPGPRLGQDTRWYTENGRLEKVTKSCTAIYAVELVAEFTENEEKDL